MAVEEGEGEMAHHSVVGVIKMSAVINLNLFQTCSIIRYYVHVYYI